MVQGRFSYRNTALKFIIITSRLKSSEKKICEGVNKDGLLCSCVLFGRSGAFTFRFTAKNITSRYTKPFEENAFTDEVFAPTNVYALNNSGNISETGSATVEPQPFICALLPATFF